MSTKSLLLFLFFLSSIIVSAQKDFATSLSFSLLDEHIGLPVDVYLDGEPEKYHFGGALSIERSSYHSGFYRFSHVLQLGYWKHDDREQVAYIALKPKLAFYLGNLIDLHFVPGLGYARSLPVGESYRQENGAFAARQDLGKGHFMPSFGVGIGLHLKPITGAPVSVFVRHESAVLFPYPSTLTHLGFTIGFGDQ